MPLLGTRGAASARGFGFTALTGIGGPYWIGTLGDGNYLQYGYGVTVDTSGNMYFTGSSGSYNGNDAQNAWFVAKYNTSGVRQWQKYLGQLPNYIESFAITVDAAGNVYPVGYMTNNRTVVKLNPSGVVQWSRSISFTNGGSGRAYAVAVDSSSNVYLSGYGPNTIGTQTGAGINKFDNTPTLQWFTTYYPNLDTALGTGVAVDSSGNIYMSVYIDADPNYGIVVKLNSSGALQWDKTINTGGYDRANAISLDSSNNVYVAGRINGLSSSGACALFKFNSSGTLQWQRKIGSNATMSYKGVAVDSSGNIYAAGDAPGSQTIITKYNSSGVIQWQRNISAGANNVGVNAISVDISGNIYISGYANIPVRSFFFAKLPSDGSKTGTYNVGGVSFTYAASSYTEAVSAASVYASGNSTQSPATSVTTPTFTLANASLTSSVTTL